MVRTTCRYARQQIPGNGFAFVPIFGVVLWAWYRLTRLYGSARKSGNHVGAFQHRGQVVILSAVG